MYSDEDNTHAIMSGKLDKYVSGSIYICDECYKGQLPQGNDNYAQHYYEFSEFGYPIGIYYDPELGWVLCNNQKSANKR